MTKQEATAAIAEKRATAMALIKEATKIADKYKLGFSWDLAYGMGGYYEGNPEYRDSDYNDGGWQSSSQGC